MSAIEKLIVKIFRGSSISFNEAKRILLHLGYQNFDKKLERDLENKKVVLGGCTVTDHDPHWECNDCYHRWEKNEVKKK